MLTVVIERQQVAPVIHLSGRLDGHGAAVFEQETAVLKFQRAPLWIVDFSSVDYLSSAGLRALITAEKTLRSSGGGLILACLAPTVAFVLESAGLLGQFRTADNVGRALNITTGETASAKNLLHKNIGSTQYTIHTAYDAASVLELWGDPARLHKTETSAGLLDGYSLAELGFGFGVGGLGANREQAAEAVGEFVSTPRMAGVIPADGFNHPDFLVTDRPAASIVYASAAIGLSGSPAARIRMQSTAPQSLRKTVADLFTFFPDRTGGIPSVIAFLIMARASEIRGTFFRNPEELKAGKPSGVVREGPNHVLIVGLALDELQKKSLRERSFQPLFNALCPDADSASPNLCHAFGVILGGVPESMPGGGPETILPLLGNPENLRSMFRLDADTLLVNSAIWLYVPSAMHSGALKRLKISLSGGDRLRDEWEVITRNLFSNASEVVLEPLHGGFTACTWRAIVFDGHGRRLSPMVLKIGARDNITREVSACRDYVQKFILNNSTAILGTAIQGDSAGVCYNFVGVSGPESRLVWLRDHYEKRPAEEILSLFDRIFTDILKPWYGQPRWELIYPYKEHNPSGELFPNILNAAQSELGLSPDQESIACPILGVELPNPYYVLKHLYPEWNDHSMMWYCGVNHGDLNMQNILLDERENIYIIDFSETRPRNIVSDFARFEPIFLFEQTRCETEADLAELLPFVRDLYSGDSIADPPPFHYKGSDPRVAKAHAMISRLRRYADIVTLFETDMLPYWLAVLEWSLPVCCYTGLPQIRKQLALYTSAILCRRVLEKNAR